jgi:flagellar motor protein MotB
VQTELSSARSDLEAAQKLMAEAIKQRDASQREAALAEERANRSEESRERLAAFVRYVRDSGVMPVLGRLAEADARRTEILELVRQRLLSSKINVEVDAGEGTLRLPSTLLFESAKADPTQEGTAIIRELGVALADIVPCYVANADRPVGCPADNGGVGVLSAVYVEGHTDAAAFRNAIDRFRNNWDLSAARAIEAFRIIRESDPRIAAMRNDEGQALLGVSGYSDTRPSARDVPPERRLEDTVRERDRRIEIRLIMSVDENEVRTTIRDINQRLGAIDDDLR